VDRSADSHNRMLTSRLTTGRATLRRALTGLRVRLCLLVMLAIVPAFGLILFSAASQRTNAREHAVEDALRTARLAALQQDDIIGDAEQLLSVLAHLPAVQQRDGPACGRIFAEVLLRYPAFTNFWADEPNGNVFCSSNVLTAPYSNVSSPWFVRAITSRSFTVGEYQTGRFSGRPIISMAYPVLGEDGEIHTVLATALDLTWLSRAIAQASLPQGAVLTVIDRDGAVLAHYPGPDRQTGDTPPRAALSTAILAQGEGSAEATDAGGQRRLYGFTSFGSPSTGVYVSVGIPKSAAYAAADSDLRRNLIGLGVVALLALVAAWFGGDLAVLRRVRRLTAAANRLQDGDLSARTNLPHSEGELGRLSRAFDHMAAALQQRDEAVRSSERQYRTLAHHIPNGIVAMFDRDLRFLLADGMGLTTLGRTSAAMEGHTIWEVLPPKTVEVIEPLFRAVFEGTAGDAEVPYGRQMRRVVAVPLRDEDGVIIAGLAITQDITAGKQAEAELRRQRDYLQALHETNMLVLSRLDLDELLMRMLMHAGELVGAPHGLVYLAVPGEDAIESRVGTGNMRASLGIRPQRGVGFIGTVWDRGEPLIVNDYAGWPGRMNKSRAYEIHASVAVPLVLGDQVVGVIGLSHTNAGARFNEGDVQILQRFAETAAIALENARLYRAAQDELAERRRAEAALRESTETLRRTLDDLARSNRDLQQFAYVASHDLQEPLRMVSSYTQLLARRYKGKLGADADDFITYAVDGATRMQRMITDLLAYSRVSTTGKEPSPADCEEILARTLDNLRTAIDESGAVVTHDPLPVVHGDSAQLGQIFQNLIGNALKFHGDVPPWVHVAVEQTADGWTFAVQDHGIGISPEFSDRIFVLFQRLHTRDEYPGTGIGLAICKKVIDRHGGRIWVESEPGAGSTFYFTIPSAVARAA
jgi:PAS domain S-box-containing protein